MITTGSPRPSVRKTEIVDLANGVSCSDMTDFPGSLSNGVAASLVGTPVVCGGYGFPGYSEKCFKFTNSVWEEYASMKEKRYAAAAVVHNDTLHVFGGKSDT